MKKKVFEIFKKYNGYTKEVKFTENMIDTRYFIKKENKDLFISELKEIKGVELKTYGYYNDNLSIKYHNGTRTLIEVKFE